jgi:hypothetical protein
MSLIDINAVEEKARKQVAEETSEKAVKALVVLYKKLDAASRCRAQHRARDRRYQGINRRRQLHGEVNGIRS